MVVLGIAALARTNRFRWWQIALVVLAALFAWALLIVLSLVAFIAFAFRNGPSGAHRCTGGARIVEIRPMTLRQYLERERYQILDAVLTVCCWIGMAASVYLLKPFGRLAQSLGAVGSISVPFSGPLLRRLIRCPRCSARLGELAQVHALAYRQTKRGRDPTAPWKLEQLGGCQSCGLRLDEEIGTQA